MKPSLARRCAGFVFAFSTFTSLVCAQSPQSGSTYIFNQQKDVQLSLYSNGGGSGANSSPKPVSVSGPPNIDNQMKPMDGVIANITGTLMVITPDNVSRLDNAKSNGTLGIIAYISCDQQDYVSSFFDAPRLLDLVSNSLNLASNTDYKGAALLYSRTASWCSVAAATANQRIFTMGSASDSSEVYNALSAGLFANQTTWISDHQFKTTSTDSGPNAVSMSSPSTTIAMIVLYSITGIITCLFLLIIVLGAVRAHRHPERYGPRNVLGMPRQSRARGMARALLDTIPIVKFGENEQTKSTDSTSDVELAQRAVGHAGEASTTTPGSEPLEESPPFVTNNQKGAATDSNQTATEGTPASDMAEIPAEVPGAETVHVQPATLAIGRTDDQSVQCPICTEDFVRGEPARHLPCNHHFHPACIDPWLLNVSSTCPLCRVDLNPPRGGNHPTEQGTGTEETQSRPNVTRWGRGGFLSFRDLGRATREERLEALRQARAERRTGEDESSGGTRGNRISRLFHGNRQPRAMPQDATAPETNYSSNAQRTNSASGRSDNDVTNHTD